MSGEPAYLNFDLLIHKESSDFIARVTESPTGEAWTSFPPPLEAFEAQHLRLLMVRSRGTVRSVDARSATMARDVGERLFKAAFKEDVHASFTSSLRLAEQQKKKLRIRLRLTDPEAAQLPWEYLRDPSSGGRFLALDDDTPIVRYMEVPHAPRQLSVESSIRILAVIAAPTDREGLDAEVEWANLQQAIAPLVERGVVTVTRLGSSTFAALEQALMRDDYHIFHFVGHGGYDPGTQDGVVVFTKEDGTSQLISSDQLGLILGDEKTLQLAVLNACDGAVSEGKDIFAGSAQRLVGHGVPAVVAMQAEITDSAAIAFSGRFYEALASGDAVDDALVRGRKAIFTQPNQLEWGTPVLYMRGDGRLFDVTAAVATAPAPDAIPAADVTPPVPAAEPVAAASSVPVSSPAPTTRGVTTAPAPIPATGSAAVGTIPITVTPPMPRLGGARWRWLLGGFGGALLLLAIIGSLVEEPPIPPDATVPAADAAQAAVLDFFVELEEEDYYDAWMMLSERSRAETPYEEFAATYDDVYETYFDPRDAVVVDPELVRVNGKITAILSDEDGDEVEVEYGGAYLVRLVAGHWYIDSAEFIETRRR